MQKWPRPSSYLGKWDPKRHTHSERQMDKQTHTQPNSKINLILLSALKWLHLYSGRKNKHRQRSHLGGIKYKFLLKFQLCPFLPSGYRVHLELRGDPELRGDFPFAPTPCAHPHLTFCSNSLVSMVLNKSTE